MMVIKRNNDDRDERRVGLVTHDSSAGPSNQRLDSL